MFSRPILKQAVADSKLIAFADDVLLIAKDKVEAKTLIREIEALSEFGIKLNKSKT